MTIIITEKTPDCGTFRSVVRKNEDFFEIGTIEKRLCKEFDFILNGVSDLEIRIGVKVRNSSKSLNEFVENQRGAILQNKIQTRPKSASDYYVLGGKQIGRYKISRSEKGVIAKKIVDDSKARLDRCSLLFQRIVAHITHPSPRILIMGSVAEQLNVEDYVIVDTINQLRSNGYYDPKFILGILNSRFISWYCYRFIFANAIRTMQFDNPTTSRIPFPNVNLEERNMKTKYDSLISFVEELLGLYNGTNSIRIEAKHEELQSKIIFFEDRINQTVYDLYGLTDEERRVIESD